MFPKDVDPGVKAYLIEAVAKAQQWTLPSGESSCDCSPQSLKHVAVIGGGTMGRGIAISLCLAGYETILIENDQESLEACRRELEKTYSRELKLKRMDANDVNRLKSKAFSQSLKLEELRNVDLVIEAVFENMKLKQQLFSKIDEICQARCVFGSNTSSLDIDDMAGVLKDPSRLVGIHFFNPAHVIRVVEVVHGKNTSGQTVATAFEACRAMQKVAVLVKNCPCFLFNRLLFVYMDQAHRLLFNHGLLPQTVDKAVTGAGFLMGPLTVHDMNGIDVGAKVKSEQGMELNPIEKELLKFKRLGRKSGAGFYKYDEQAKKQPDPYLEDMIYKLSQNAVKSTAIRSDKDIVNYLLYPLINEGFNCIEDGVIAEPSLIDIMFVLGFGWPASTGGPMRWAEKEGLHHIHASMQSWKAQDPEGLIYSRISEKLQYSVESKI